jgi:ATP-dependent RNA helicase RhlE
MNLTDTSAPRGGLNRPKGRRFWQKRPVSVPRAAPVPAPRSAPLPGVEEEVAFPTVVGNAFGQLIPELQRALRETGYTVPTPVQDRCIGPLLAGRDLLGSAQTGTGKTAAFVLPLLQYLAGQPRDRVSRKPRVLILAPTRELAAQIGASIGTYGKHLELTHAVIFGGVGQYAQEKAMNRGVDLLVATPGRLLDLIRQRFVQLDAVEAFVLDEADRMLDMGFIHDVRKVIALLPSRRQSLFFSATLLPEVVALAGTMLRDAVRVTVTPEQPTVESIRQRVMFVDKGRKETLLTSLLDDSTMRKVIVFVQRKRVADTITKRLQSAGIEASAIHGNKSQNARTAALESFRGGRVRVLVATDIAARGIDVDGITHVMNYELPNEPEIYIHRIGRTARAGAGGDAVAFCSASERNQWRDIERLIRKPVPIDRDHPHHSDEAERATGEAAKPPARGQPGQSRRTTVGRRDGQVRLSRRGQAGGGGFGGRPLRGGGGGGRRFGRR